MKFRLDNLWESGPESPSEFESLAGPLQLSVQGRFQMVGLTSSQAFQPYRQPKVI